jgi:uncharacterized membrane protein
MYDSAIHKLVHRDFDFSTTKDQLMETNQLTSFAEEHATSVPPATGSSQINVGTGERIASVVGGTALGIYAAKNFNTVGGKIAGIVGILLLKRGTTGYCEVNNAIGRNTAHKKARAMEVRATHTINKSREEVFAFWRNFQNLPTFMKHLQKVEVLDDVRSKWTAKLPGGVGSITWEAVIDDEVQNSYISWSSLPGSTIDNAGEVRFSDAPDGATIMHASISYRLPVGDAGGIAGKLFNPIVERMIKHDIKRFKSLLETGEIFTNKSGSARSLQALDTFVE